MIIDKVDNQGYVPDLNTTATVIVDAINEVLADLIIAESDISDIGDQVDLNVTAIGLNTTHRSSDGKTHADVVLNNTHRSSDGKNHADVVLNNTHRSSDGKNHSDVVINNAKNSYPSGDSTKVGYLTVTAAINLNKVAEYTEIMGSTVAVSNATTKPASNISLTVSVDTYDAIDVEIEYLDKMETVRVRIGANADEDILGIDNAVTTSTNSVSKFKLYRDSSTTLTAYYGRLIAYGSSYLNVATTDINILKIYGVKFT